MLSSQRQQFELKVESKYSSDVKLNFVVLLRKSHRSAQKLGQLI